MSGRTPNALPTYEAGSTRDLLAGIDRRVALELALLDEAAEVGMADEAVEWLMHLRVSRGLAIQTVQTYCKNISRFFAWLRDGRIALNDVDLQCLEDWQRWMYAARRYGEQFRAQHIAAVRQFFVWRERFRGVASPARHMRTPKITKRVPRKFTSLELQKLFATCDLNAHAGIRDYALLLFFYATGARKEEAQRLDMQHLTLHERTGQVKFLGKGAKEREVSFQGEVVDALRRWLTLRDSLNVSNKNAVWVGLAGQSEYGERITSRAIESMLKRRIKKSGISAHGLHTLRVTFATDLYDEGVDIEIIQQLLGHEKIETTRRYIVVSERKRKTKMPVRRINIVTGRASNELPRWIRQKQSNIPMQHDD